MNYENIFSFLNTVNQTYIFYTRSHTGIRFPDFNKYYNFFTS